MYKIFKRIAIVVSSVLLAACGSDNQPQPNIVQQQLQDVLVSKYAAYKSANNLPENAGALVYIHTPNGVSVATAGFSSNVNENYHFRIASNTKTFTAAAIMLLDQQKRLNIDDHVTDTIPNKAIPYLPTSPSYQIPYKSSITIKQLLSHRAGVFDVTNDPVPPSSNAVYAGKTYVEEYIYKTLGDGDHQFTFDELVGVNAVNQLSYWPPDGGYHYSNTGYSLLAVIIERVTGQSYGQFIAETFFAPMGLNATSAPWSSNERALPQPFMRGFSNTGDGYRETTKDNMSANVAEGNIISTAADLATWIRTLLTGNGPVNKNQVARMITIPPGNEQKQYALGISRYADIGYGHTGAHMGYMSLSAYNPQDNLTVVVFLPFLDFTKVDQQGEFVLGLGKEARKIAGYMDPW